MIRAHITFFPAFLWNGPADFHMRIMLDAHTHRELLEKGSENPHSRMVCTDAYSPSITTSDSSISLRMNSTSLMKVSLITTLIPSSMLQNPAVLTSTRITPRHRTVSALLKYGLQHVSACSALMPLLEHVLGNLQASVCPPFEQPLCYHSDGLWREGVLA